MSKIKLAIFLLLILTFWRLLTPTPHIASDFHYLYGEILRSGFTQPLVWFENINGLGEYIISILWFWPLYYLYTLGGALEIDFIFLEAMLGFLPSLVLAFWGAYKLLEYLKIGRDVRLIGAFFYLTNTYFLLLLDGGQIGLALAYSILPLAFVFYRRALESQRWKERIFFILSVITLSIFDIRVIYFLIILIGIDFLFEINLAKNRLKKVSQYIILGLLTAFFLVGIHSYWIVPSIFSKVPTLPLTYDRPQQLEFLSFANIGHTLFLISPHWPENIFGKITSLKAEFVLIPILVFLAPIVRPKNRWVAFWLVVSMVGIFLSKGVREPFNSVYPWLFSNVWGFSMFRDPTKFYFFISLGYLVLLAISLDSLINNIKWSKFRNIFLTVSLIYLVFLIKPVFEGRLSGTFSKANDTEQYFSLAEKFKSDPNFGRVFWIPKKHPLGYSGPGHYAVEASKLVSERPFAIGTRGAYETFNFLREAPYMGEIFDVSAIGYIAYPYLDPRRDDMHPDNIRYYYTFSNQLSNLPWLSKVDNSPIPLWKTKQNQDRFFITPNVWWVVGSDSIYNEATKSAKLALSKNSLVFVEEYPNLGERIDQIPEAKIVLNNKTITDLAASFINPQSLIFPAKSLNFDPDESGWWKREALDLIRWRDFLQSKYEIGNQDFDLGGGWAVGEGIKKLKIKNEKLKINGVLLARVLESTRSGELSFYQDRQLIGNINTKKEGNNIRWFEVGKLTEGKDYLTIESSGQINVINALAILDSQQWIMYQKKAEQFRSTGKIVNYDGENAKDTLAGISYSQINPAKYLVNVTGLTEPVMLVFSQTYDGLWKLNGQSSLPVYSLLNAFKVEKDGEYLVEYEAQKWVYPGLVISGITVLVILFLLARAGAKSF